MDLDRRLLLPCRSLLPSARLLPRSLPSSLPSSLSLSPSLVAPPLPSHSLSFSVPARCLCGCESEQMRGLDQRLDKRPRPEKTERPRQVKTRGVGGVDKEKASLVPRQEAYTREAFHLCLRACLSLVASLAALASRASLAHVLHLLTCFTCPTFFPSLAFHSMMLMISTVTSRWQVCIGESATFR